jgi:hypothetical protein
MSVTLVAAVACLALWVVLVFVQPVGLGVVHLLLAGGAALWIRWWALRPVRVDR